VCVYICMRVSVWFGCLVPSCVVHPRASDPLFFGGVYVWFSPVLSGVTTNGLLDP
jgi:hypothetical protein